MPQSVKRGVSLLEVMFAIGILASALLSLLLVFGTGLSMLASASDLDVSTEVAREELERIQSHVEVYGFDYLPAGGFSYDGTAGEPATVAAGMPPFPPPPYPEIVANDGKTRCRLLVTGQDLSADNRSVVVRVFFNDRDGSATLETHFHR